MPFEIPESWCWTTLGELCSIKGGKRLPKGKSFADTITPHIYIRVTDMKDHTVLLSSLKYIDEDVFAEIKNYTISSNDLYLTIAGTIGDVGLVPAELDGANLTENAAKLTDVKCSKQYLMYVLMSSIAQDHFCSRFHQVAQPKLSLETASSTLIPLPPYGEQLRIAEELDRWLGVVVSVEDDLSELTNYVRKTKSKILDLAISGKLVPQDPNDEPAIELLKRINPDFEPCDNSHYENLPQGWAVCKIKDIFNITMGQSPTGESINGVKGIEFHQGKIHFTESYLSQSGVYTDQPTKIAEVDSLLLCVRAPVGVLNITQRKICIGRGLCALKPKYEIDNLYWLFILTAYKDYFESNATGSTFKAISGDTIKNAVIKLPPLQEQKRILSSIISLYESLDAITAEL